MDVKNIFRRSSIKILSTFVELLRYLKNKKTKRNVLSFYDNNPTTNLEINIALDYIRNHKHYSSISRIKTFPYPFSDNYSTQNVKIFLDGSNNLLYVIRNGKKLYFRRNMSYKKAIKLYNSLLIEQDKESAHLYLTDEFNIVENDILADVGCAEAFLALDVIEKIKKAYLFEYDDLWIEALNYTFAPWREKVEIIKKYVTDRTENNCITLDDFFTHKEMPTFIKIDVEGAEIKVLNGMRHLIDLKNKIRLAICTYHQTGDYEKITEFVRSAGLNYVTSKNYMLFNVIPYFRRGLIRVIK